MAKGLPLLLLLWLMPSLVQGEAWNWLMADTEWLKPTCPGRCLQVNDSKTPDVYVGQVVGFSACQTESPNQRWILQQQGDGYAISIVEPHSPNIFCLQPQEVVPGNFSIVVAVCTNAPNQTWSLMNETSEVVTKESFHLEPLYLTMEYSKILQDSDPKKPWHAALLYSPSAPGLYGPLPTISKKVALVPSVPDLPGNSTSGNLLQNGGFEFSSYLDDEPSEVEVELSSTPQDIFGLCYWNVVQGAVQVYSPAVSRSGGGSNGYLSLLLNGKSESGAVEQIVKTELGSRYVLTFFLMVQEKCPSSGVAVVKVDASPSGVESLSFNVTGSDQGPNSWHAVSFLAQSVQTSIRFESLTPPETGCGPCIDTVQVIVQGEDGLDGLPYSPSPEESPRLASGPGVQEHRSDRLPSVTLSRGAISGIVLGAAAVAFGVGSLAFALLVAPISNKLSRRNNSEQQMLPKTNHHWDSPPSPSSSRSFHSASVD